MTFAIIWLVIDAPQSQSINAFGFAGCETPVVSIRVEHDLAEDLEVRVNGEIRSSVHMLL